MNNKLIRLSKIDETTREYHTRLLAEDECLYLFEKTSGKDYSFSDTNNLISNLKKPVSSSPSVLAHKNRAIAQCAQSFSSALNSEWLKEATLVPVPPSKSKSHSEYDDRIERVCSQIRTGQDVRNIVFQTDSTAANHHKLIEPRATVEDLLQIYAIDEDLTEPKPKQIGIVDDIITAGTHFRAMHTILTNRFPGVKITGLFIARRIFHIE